jgi:hypothetical protein
MVQKKRRITLLQYRIKGEDLATTRGGQDGIVEK